MISERARQDISRILDTDALHRVRVGLGGSHTVVTYPPLDALIPAKGPVSLPVMAEDLHLYLHVAFCEHICPFCHYAKTYSGVDQDSSLVEMYLDALKMELDLRRGFVSRSKVNSLYVGGGTPTALSVQRLEQLFNGIKSLVPEMPTEICVETSPISIADASGPSKLKLLEDFGVNRLSVGVQTFNDCLLTNYRGHDRAALDRALGRLAAFKGRYNLDLMQDLPFQSEAMIVEDLEAIDQYRPHQVTWYLLRFHDESTWHKMYVRGDLEGVPGSRVSAERRLLINREMNRLGYRHLPGGRFVRDHSEDLYKASRSGLRSALLGFGASAYSYAGDDFFRNAAPKSTKRGITEYHRTLNSGADPIAWHFRFNKAEREAQRFVQAIRDHISVSLLDTDTAYVDYARRTLNMLVDCGAAFVRPDGGIELTEAGSAFEEEITSLFYSGAVQSRLAGVNKYWAAQPRDRELAAVSVE